MNGTLAGAQLPLGVTNVASSKIRKNATETIYQSHIEVLRAENGYIVRFAVYQGEVAKMYIAQSVDEIRSFLAAEMALAQLEG